MGDPVLYTATAGVARIVLNRPEVSNAVDLPMAEAIGVAVARATVDDAVRSLLIVGAGDRFCAGGDLAAMTAAAQRLEYVRTLATTLDRALEALTSMPKPVVAAVQGTAAGAGLAAVL